MNEKTSMINEYLKGDKDCFNQIQDIPNCMCDIDISSCYGNSEDYLKDKFILGNYEDYQKFVMKESQCNPSINQLSLFTINELLEMNNKKWECK